MDIIDLGCSVLRTSFSGWFMAMVEHFGHGSVGSVVGLLLVAHGFVYHNERSQRAGAAILTALIIAGIASEGLKYVFQWPRPTGGSSFGFPSGRASAAFALAAVLTAAFPNFGPFFYALAVLAAISRLYFRAHFIWGVLGGAIIGIATGLATAHHLIPRVKATEFSPVQLTGWVGVVFLTIIGLAFFSLTERNINSSMTVPSAAQSTPAVATLDFGIAQARDHLRHGWSIDEQWLNGKQSVVWATGMASELTLELPAAQDLRFRVQAIPYSPSGLACQSIEITVNDLKVSKLFLERGWHSYEFAVPGTAIRPGRNSIQFFYIYAESPKLRGRSPDERVLSVAFDRLDVVAAR
jgi:membrane-associated phospholipid phosphatase